MGKKILFYILLGVLGIFLVIESQKLIQESFQNPINIPLVKPDVAPLGTGDPQPYNPPNTALLSPPPGQTASVNSYPAKDPAQEKANLKRIKGVLESIKGFLGNELKGLEELSDPAVKLPLESLKADARTLEDEKSVLTKNPGIESTLSQQDVAGMEANLRYLEKKWRLSANSATIEGFQNWFNDASAAPPAKINLAELYDYNGNPIIPKAVLPPPQPIGGSSASLLNGNGLPSSSSSISPTGPTGQGSTGPTGFGSTGPTGAGSKGTGPTGSTGFVNVNTNSNPNSYNWFNSPTGSFNWFDSTGSTGPTGSVSTDTLQATIRGYKLNMDYNSVVNSGNQKLTQFKVDLVTNLGNTMMIPLNRIRIDSIEPGSVIVSFTISPGMPNAQTSANAFLTALNNPSSNLYKGNITSSSDATTAPSLTYSNAGPNQPANPVGGPGVPGSTGGSGTGRASMSNLRDLVVRISAEIMRLQASGTTDPIVTQRVNLLNDVMQSVKEIIRQVETGQMTVDQIPITEASYLAFLPVMANMGKALPRLINSNNMNPGINSLFPIYGDGDISGASLARSIFDKYAGNLLKNISWNLNLKYTGESEMNIAQEIAKGLGQSTSTSGDTGNTYGAAPTTEYRGMFDSLIKSKTSTGSTGPGHASPEHLGAVSKLDWKTRSRQICEQITRRGLNQYDYGCMKDTGSVSETFSFRGYAKMICNRLSTNYDPGIPELCGCPPPTWAGWRG